MEWAEEAEEDILQEGTVEEEDSEEVVDTHQVSESERVSTATHSDNERAVRLRRWRRRRSAARVR